MLRELAGPDALMMLDVNQHWTFPEAMEMSRGLLRVAPYWIEEPTHPDDVHAHSALAKAVAPLRIAVGEHVPNWLVFKNFVQPGAVHFVQADCARLAGISEFLEVRPLARAGGLPIVSHAGDMGQIHEHILSPDPLSLGRAGREEQS